MKRTLLTSVIVGAALGVVFVTSGTDAHASEVDGVWTPRTVDQIKADINKAKDNKYTIVWGDTLSGISQATNITVQKLADMNKIANVDLIYAGNTLVFEGNVVTTQDANGETVAQTVIQPEDKNDATKPVGKQEATGQAVSEGTIGSENTTTAAQAETSQAAPTVGEYGQLEGFYSKEYTEDGRKYVEAGPFRTDKDFKNWFAANYPNEELQGYGSVGGYTVPVGGSFEWRDLIAKAQVDNFIGETPEATPSETTPETPETAAQPAEQSAPADQPNTSSQSTTTEQPGTNGYATMPDGTKVPIIDPDTLADQEPAPESIGDSGKVFNSEEEANNYGWQVLKEGNGEHAGFWVEPVFNKNYEPLNKWTVDFYEDKESYMHFGA